MNEIYRDPMSGPIGDGMTLEGTIKSLQDFAEEHPELAAAKVWMDGCDCAGLFSGVVQADGLGGVIMTRLD